MIQIKHVAYIVGALPSHRLNKHALKTTENVFSISKLSIYF